MLILVHVNVVKSQMRLMITNFSVNSINCEDEHVNRHFWRKFPYIPMRMTESTEGTKRIRSNIADPGCKYYVLMTFLDQICPQIIM